MLRSPSCKITGWPLNENIVVFPGFFFSKATFFSGVLLWPESLAWISVLTPFIKLIKLHEIDCHWKTHYFAKTHSKTHFPFPYLKFDIFDYAPFAFQSWEIEIISCERKMMKSSKNGKSHNDNLNCLMHLCLLCHLCLTLSRRSFSCQARFYGLFLVAGTEWDFTIP